MAPHMKLTNISSIFKNNFDCFGTKGGAAMAVIQVLCRLVSLTGGLNLISLIFQESVQTFLGFREKGGQNMN